MVNILVGFGVDSLIESLSGGVLLWRLFSPARDEGREKIALKADSRQTDLCAYLSAILLGGLALNALLGWWWADPVAALIMAPIIAREGFESLRGEAGDDCRC